MSNEKKISKKEPISNVDRVLNILDYLARERNGSTLTKMSSDLDIPKTTVYRLLESLVSRGYVSLNNATETYSIGMEAITLSMNALTNMNVVEISIPYLKELASKTEETTFLGVYNDGEIIYLYKEESSRSFTITSQLGSRRPVHSTGLGKAILSGFPMQQVSKVLEEKGMKKMAINTITTPEDYFQELNNVRLNGYAMDNEELEEGLGCYAAPVYDYSGKVIAAICVSGPIERIQENSDVLIKELKDAVNMISKRLGFVPSMLYL